MIPEETIRLRSYFIWQREGCPQGKEIEHWRRAVAELTVEHEGLAHPGQCAGTVMPRLPISKRPERVIAERIAVSARAA